MWTVLADLLLAGFKWLFGGKQQAEGEQLGELKQANAAQAKELEDVRKSEVAAGNVSNDPASLLDDPRNRRNWNR